MGISDILQAKDIRLRLEQDARSQLILRDSIIWITYVFVLLIVCLGHSSVHDAYRTNVAVIDLLGKGVSGNIHLEHVRLCIDICMLNLCMKMHFCIDFQNVMYFSVLCSIK